MIQVNIGSMELTANHNIKQLVEICSDFEKRGKLIKHLDQISAENAKVLIFVGTKRVADDITKYLRQDGWPALAIHGDKEQYVLIHLHGILAILTHSFRAGVNAIGFWVNSKLDVPLSSSRQTLRRVVSVCFSFKGGKRSDQMPRSLHVANEEAFCSFGNRRPAGAGMMNGVPCISRRVRQRFVVPFTHVFLSSTRS